MRDCLGSKREGNGKIMMGHNAETHCVYMKVAEGKKWGGEGKAIEGVNVINVQYMHCETAMVFATNIH